MTRVAIVTGGNKGIGYATCHALSKKFDGDVFLTARSAERGNAAVEELEKEGCSVRFHQLDIDDTASIEKMRDFMKEKYGGIDVLVNNAAIAFSADATEPMSVQAEVTCKTNYWSTKNACDILFPVLKPGARVVNVSSVAGLLTMLPEDSPWKEKLARSGSDLTVKDVDAFVEGFVASAKDGSWAEKGYSNRCYCMSKVALSALTRIQQQRFDENNGSDVVVNHVHPGIVDTDMTRHRGVMTIEEGAKSSVYAALLPPKTEVRGEFINDDCSVKDWVEYRFKFEPTMMKPAPE